MDSRTPNYDAISLCKLEIIKTTLHRIILPVSQRIVYCDMIKAMGYIMCEYVSCLLFGMQSHTIDWRKLQKKQIQRHCLYRYVVCFEGNGIYTIILVETSGKLLFSNDN